MYLKCSIIIFVFFISYSTFATKACPLSPCLIEGKFEHERCKAIASWIATGNIQNVKRNVKGKPLNKDFSSFVFKIKKVEKGILKNIDFIKFKVGWCYNQKEVPSNYDGTFRFYGKSNPTSENGKYFYFIK